MFLERRGRDSLAPAERNVKPVKTRIHPFIALGLAGATIASVGPFDCDSVCYFLSIPSQIVYPGRD